MLICIQVRSNFHMIKSLYCYMDALLGRKLNGWRSYTAITHECCEQYWTSPGSNTSQGTNYTTTCLPSRKLLDEPDTQDTAVEIRTNSSVMYSYGPPHMAKQKQDNQLEHTFSSYVRTFWWWSYVYMYTHIYIIRQMQTHTHIYIYINIL